MSAVALRDVCFSYDGQNQVLKHISFTAEHGEITLLAGPSGCGKSTLLAILSGIIPNITPGTLTGEVCIDGASILGRGTDEICRQVGIVLQNPEAQIVHKRVEDEIAFGLENLGLAEERIARQIETVCKLMSLDTDWQTRTLSGGQKQRLVTASTLAMGQKILVLDEPLANLDQTGGRELMELLRDLAGHGYAVIVVEHRLDLVLPYADALWAMENGTVHRVTETEAYLRTQTRKIADNLPLFTPEDDLFTLEHISYRVGDRDILQDVTFSVPRGARMVILGENGCGKTTLLRLIARLNRPTGGKLTQHLEPGFDRRSRPDRAWFRAVGVVYQNPNYQLFMPTVRQEVAFGAVSQDYADEILEQFSIAHLADRHPQSLSEGQKRRVSIAAIAATKPKVLLLDEPTVGQDYHGLKEQVELLNELHRQSGCTMLTVTHDVRCAEALCDRAVLIADGVVQRQGGKELVRTYFGV
ncbi:MAG: ATP-binding cassette domain-containing protein [Clostridiales bacterium]|nr:ATP-binding cassette domain-containing protein [Clostridiales bacterium]